MQTRGLSVRRAHGGGTDAMRGALRFEMLTRMYQGESSAKYGGKTYEVTSERRGHRTILTLTEVPHGQLP